MAQYLPSFPSARQAQISVYWIFFLFNRLTELQLEQTRETCSMSCHSRSKRTPCSAPGWVSACLSHTCTTHISHPSARNKMALEVGQRGRPCAQVALLRLDSRSRSATRTCIFHIVLLADIAAKPCRLLEKNTPISGNILPLVVERLPELRG